MAILRIVAWVLVGLALMLLGADAISTLEAGIPVIRTTGEILTLIGLPVSELGGGGAASVANFFITAPLWALLGGIGVILTLVLRPIAD